MFRHLSGPRNEQGHGESEALAVVRETYVSRDERWTESNEPASGQAREQMTRLCVSNHNRKSLIFEDGDEADTIYPNLLDLSCLESHQLCFSTENLVVDMRHAAAGNALMLTLATSASYSSHSHTSAAHPAAVGMSRQNSRYCGCKRLLGRWPGPLLTVLNACECHSRTEEHRADTSNTPHPHHVGRRCISEPARSQPGESGRQDSPRRNLRPLGRRGGQRLTDSVGGFDEGDVLDVTARFGE